MWCDPLQINPWGIENNFLLSAMSYYIMTIAAASCLLISLHQLNHMTPSRVHLTIYLW